MANYLRRLFRLYFYLPFNPYRLLNHDFTRSELNSGREKVAKNLVQTETTYSPRGELDQNLFGERLRNSVL